MQGMPSLTHLQTGAGGLFPSSVPRARAPRNAFNNLRKRPKCDHKGHNFTSRMAIHKDFAIVKTVLCSVTSLLKVSLCPSVPVCACVSEGGEVTEPYCPCDGGFGWGLIIPNIMAIHDPLSKSPPASRSHTSTSTSTW